MQFHADVASLWLQELGLSSLSLREHPQSPALETSAWALMDNAHGTWNLLCETMELNITPKQLMDPGARSAFFKANRGKPKGWNQAMIQLGTVQVKAGDKASEIELELPASAGY